MTARALLFYLLLSASILSAGSSGSGTGTTAFYKEMSALSNEDLQLKALHYVHEEMPDSAFLCYTVMANRLGMQKLSDDDLLKSVMAVNNLGYMYYFFYHDYQKAFSCLTQALRASEKYKQEQAQEAIYLNFANVYRLYSDYLSINDYSDKIISYYKKSFHVSRKYNEVRFMLVSFYGLAHYAYWTGKTRDIRTEMKLVRTAKINPGYPMLDFDLDLCDAIDSMEVRNYPGALKRMQAMLTHNNARDTRERYDVMTLQRMADVCIRMNDYAKAEAFLDQAEKLALKLRAEDLIVYVYKEYITLYAQKHDLAKKTDYENKYLRGKDTLMNKGKLKMVEKMHFMEELDRANEKMVFLYQEQQRHRIIFLAVVAVAVILTLSITALTINYRKLKASYLQLYRRNVEMLEQDDHKRRKATTANGRPRVTAPTGDGTDDARPAAAEELKKLQEAIDNVLTDDKEICSLDFDLSRLADLIDVKYWTLSKNIKAIYGKNFNALLGEYRIKEACRRLNDMEHYGNYSVGGVGLSVGFRSRPNFVNTFKSIVGMTPTEYRKIAKSVLE